VRANGLTRPDILDSATRLRPPCCVGTRVCEVLIAAACPGPQNPGARRLRARRKFRSSPAQPSRSAARRTAAVGPRKTLQASVIGGEGARRIWRASRALVGEPVVSRGSRAQHATFPETRCDHRHGPRRRLADDVGAAFIGRAGTRGVAPRKPAQRHPMRAHFPAVGNAIARISRCASRACPAKEAFPRCTTSSWGNRPSGPARAGADGSFSLRRCLSPVRAKAEKAVHRCTDLGGLINHTSLSSKSRCQSSLPCPGDTSRRQAQPSPCVTIAADVP